MNTGKEGKGQAVHEELELHQSHGALSTGRTKGFRSASTWRGEGSGTGSMQAGSSPPRGVSHLSCLASSSCQTRVPLLFLSCSCFPQRGCQCFVTAEMNSPCGGVPCKMRGPEEPLQGHRSQAHALLTSAGSSYFTSLSAGAAAGCVGHGQ